MRGVLLIVTLSLLTFGVVTTQAENSVHIYLPSSGGLPAQTMMVGVPATINIEIINDEILIGVKVPLLFTSSNGLRLFDPLDNSMLPFTLPPDKLTDQLISNHSRNDFPDSLVLGAYGILPEENRLQPGTYLFAQITITPTRAGILKIHEFVTNFDSLSFYSLSGQNIVPSYSAPEILVLDDDCNDNGILDITDIANNPALDCNENGIIDNCEIEMAYGNDCNENGILDDCEILYGTINDCNDNNIPDECELDCNNNGIADDCESIIDCNCNNVDDANDILSGLLTDNDLNGLPDECDLWNDELVYLYVPQNDNHGPQELIKGYTEQIYVFIHTSYNLKAVDIKFSYQSDGYERKWQVFTVDDFEFFQAPSPVDNHNVLFNQGSLWPDSLDMFGLMLFDSLPAGSYLFAGITITAGKTGTVHFENVTGFTNPDDSTSFTYSGGKVNPTFYAPDITIIELPDCNGNGIPDIPEINDGLAIDCNSNDIPDECEIAADNSLDCNANGTLDICDISSGFSQDCNANMLPDECDLDCNYNQIPDDCELITDCNCNQVDDALDIANGWTSDDNSNGIPDDCEGIVPDRIFAYVSDENKQPGMNLHLNETGYIYFQLVNENICNAVTLTLLISSINNTTLLENITENDVEHILPDQQLNYRIFGTEYHDYNWPDTFIIAMFRTSGEPLMPGSHPLFRIKVLPVNTGTITLDDIYIETNDIYTHYADENFDIVPLDMVSSKIRIDGSCCIDSRGNANGDAEDLFTISDLLMMVDYMFLTPPGPGPVCDLEADVNSSGVVDISDLLYMVDYMFADPAGPPPLPCF